MKPRKAAIVPLPPGATPVSRAEAASLRRVRRLKPQAGPMPAHEIADGRIRFQKPDGEWGQWLVLRGPGGEAGEAGEPGIGVTDASIDAHGHLVLTLDDEREIDAGPVIGPQGKAGAHGKPGKHGDPGTGIEDVRVRNGRLHVRLTDGQGIDAGAVCGPRGRAGADGVSVASVSRDDRGHLLIELSNGQRVDAGDVQGPPGETGPAGPAGVGVADIRLDRRGHLIVVLTDGREIDVGRIVFDVGGGGGGIGRAVARKIAREVVQEEGVTLDEIDGGTF